MGISAPYFAMSVISGKGFPKRAFVLWNLLGILDFVVAAFLGVLVAEALGISSGPVNIQPMTVLPLSLFPTFIVPFFTLVHLAALAQVVRKAPSKWPILSGQRAAQIG